MFRNGGKGLVLRRLMFALLGNTPGTVAAGNEEAGSSGEQGSPGGLIPIETVTLVNRVTTVADVNAAQALLYRSVYPANYAVDASGNGGGGKQAVGGGAY